MIEVRVPQLAESITEGTILRWAKAEGDRVRPGDVLIELETDKVNMEVTAEQEGVLAKILRGPGETVQVGGVIATLDEEGAAAVPAGPAAEAPVAAPVDVQPVVHVPTAGQEAPAVRAATPAARRWARENNVDLSAVQGRDPFGRVSAGDLRGAAPEAPTPAPAAVPAPVATPAPVGEKPVERVRMTRRRQTIAERLVAAQHNAAMLTTFNEVDMTAILDVRKRRQERFVKQFNVKLGFMSFFTKAVIGGLKAYPLLNAEIQGTEILLKKYYDIGVAVSTPEGLVVPVVRDADRLSFGELEAEIARLATTARDGQLKIADLMGGTFTITNGGIFGSMLSTPILNPPQVGILGMHKIMLRPVSIDETRMENRPMMYIALSYDHRIVDGREAVSFLVKVKELLEDPEALMLEG
ncbi:MAG: 2-oxoglutarate dehydrogenase complex dihydrolipoyllysine-residue succinyltransferase [Mycobacterium leprae]